MANTVNPIEPPPRSLPEDLRQWLVKVLTPRVSDGDAIKWDQIAKSGASVEDLEISDSEAAANHRAATSAHGATGDLVGQGDLATTSVAGVVKQAATVSDVAASLVNPSPAYSEAEAQSVATQVKTVSDRLDTLLAALRASGSLNN